MQNGIRSRSIALTVALAFLLRLPACSLHSSETSDQSRVEFRPVPQAVSHRMCSPTWSAHYSFEAMDETVPDVSAVAAGGEGAHHAVNAGANPIEDGARGRAAHFAGNAHVAVPGFLGGRCFTLAAWVRTTHTETQYVVAKGNNFAGSLYLRLEDGGRPRVCFLPMDNLSTVFVESDREINDGRWHHVAGALDGRALLLYIDGELDRRFDLGMPHTVTVPEYERLVYIGAFDVAEDDGRPDRAFFHGDIDEVHLTDGAADSTMIEEWTCPGERDQKKGKQ